jgi:hypothetical protein
VFLSDSLCAKTNAFKELFSQLPLQGILARMTALDAISFLKFKTSEDLRLGIQARLDKIQCQTQIPICETTIRRLVMDYAEKAKLVLKKVLVQFYNEKSIFRVLNAKTVYSHFGR